MSVADETLIIIGVLATPFAAAYLFQRFVRQRDYAGLDCVGFGLVFWVLALICGGIYAGVSESKSPDLVTLKKNEWSCVHTHKESRMVGKIITRVDVCDTYQSTTVKDED